MNRSEKTETVASLNATFNEAAVVVVTRNLGLTVAQSTDLRLKMRDAGASYKVAKNRLAKIALDCLLALQRSPHRRTRLQLQRLLSSSQRPMTNLKLSAARWVTRSLM